MNKLVANLKKIRSAESPDETPRSMASAQPRNRSGNWPTIMVATAVVAAISLVTLLGSRPDSTGPAEPQRRMPVRTETMEFVTSINQVRRYSGDVRARQSSDLGFELSGRISRIVVDEGDHVEADQILAVLDTQTLEARRDATIATLKQSKAQLNELKAGPRKETIAASRAKLQEANSALQLAKLNFERRRKLRDSEAISTEEFQRSQFGLETAQAIVDSAQKRLDELEAGTRDEQIAAQKAVVQQLKASLKEINVQIDKSTLTAPFAGRIVKRMADPGGLGLPSQPILKLVETEHLEGTIGLPADVATNLQIGDSVPISVAGQKYPGKVKAKIQQLEMATRTQNVLVEFDQIASETVLPGQLCQIELSSPLNVTGYWVPASALTNGIRGLWSLMTVDDDQRAERQDVAVIYTDGDRVLVRGALTGDALVIAEGTHRLVDGQPVEVLDNVSLPPARNASND